MGQHFGVHKFWGPRILIHPQKMDRESVMPATIVVVLIVATKDVDAGVFGLAVPRNQVAGVPHIMGGDQNGVGFTGFTSKIADLNGMMTITRI